jgi:protein SCO1/2
MLESTRRFGGPIAAPVLALLVALTLGVVGCSTNAQPASSGQPSVVVGGGQSAPPGAGPAPSTGLALDDPMPRSVADAPLVDQNGSRFTLGSLHGKTVVLADFLTLCQEVCPLISVNLRQANEAATKAGLGGKVVFVEATVDPERDTPQRMAAYMRLFGAQPGWVLATGTPSDLATLWKTLGVNYSKTLEEDGPPPTDWLTGKPLTYDVTHQDVVYVIGPDGHLRWEDQGTPNTQGGVPPKEILAFLNEEGHKNLTTEGPEGPIWTAHDVEQALTYVTGTNIS